MADKRYTDLMKQGFMKPSRATMRERNAGTGVSDAQFRQNILEDVRRRTRIMFGEEPA